MRTCDGPEEKGSGTSGGTNAIRKDDTRADARHHRAFWHSRRGMLELEFRLVPFVRERFAGMSAEDQSVYLGLLDHEDWEIFDWLQGREIPEDSAIKAMVARIIEFGKTPHGPL